MNIIIIIIMGLYLVLEIETQKKYNSGKSCRRQLENAAAPFLLMRRVATMRTQA